MFFDASSGAEVSPHALEHGAARRGAMRRDAMRRDAMRGE
jgi:hypothetical protein